jgi:16S rRNA (adenine1518-N6/adenine1519-N6)-dimethyltransferase
MALNTQLNRPSEVRGLLERLGHRPNRGLGQNFLIDANILQLIVDTAALKPMEAVLEIGPGLGALTERLLEKKVELTCIEKDQVMVNYLKTQFDAIHLIHADALKVDLQALFSGGITKVVANLPYSVASRLIVDISACATRPEQMVVTVQKEVADRITASAGSSAYGVLSLLTAYYYRRTGVKKISPTCFLPPPKVWSAVVSLEKREIPAGDDELYPTFKKVVKFCFSQRRKMLATSLRNAGIAHAAALLESIEIGPTIRPEDVALEEWVRLAKATLN